MILGFSTGAIFREVPSISNEIVNICRKLGCNAIELNTARVEEVDLFDNFIKSGETLSDFEYISMHSPGIKIVYKNNPKTIELLKKLEKAYKHFNCQYLVVHPSLIEDWSIFNRFSFNLAVENMSKDSQSFFLPEQLKKVFALNKKYSMTFDIKHAFESNLEGDKLPQEIYDNFKDKIVEIHLSGFDPHVKKHEHKPLVETNQPEIVNFLKNKLDIPIIIESDCKDIKQMKIELNYIKKLLIS